jgi:hypothetical protein
VGPCSSLVQCFLYPTVFTFVCVPHSWHVLLFNNARIVTLSQQAKHSLCVAY